MPIKSATMCKSAGMRADTDAASAKQHVKTEGAQPFAACSPQQKPAKDLR